MRALHTLYQGTAGSAARVTVPFTSLPTSVRGLQANLSGLEIRIAKGAASTVRPATATVVIRDGAETKYEGTVLELVAEAREDGKAPQVTLGAASAADSVRAEWRPGYGRRHQDRAQAAGLFLGGGVDIQLPTDAGQTYTVSVVARLLLHSRKLYLPSRAITRALSATDKGLAADYLLARLRDASHSAATEYVVTSAKGDFVRGVLGALVTDVYEALMPTADPIKTGAFSLSSIASPDFIRAVLGEREPQLTKLPESGGNMNWPNFAGAPIVTEIRPQTAGDVEAAMRKIESTHGVKLRDVEVEDARGDSVSGAGLRFSRYMPVVFSVG